ncbi:LOW QUALITY PROTEIN: hypothetical protein KUTeg_011272 [Tegillarca granosa]|uniref:Uncharacterized protein n=1 Tax=Tegillarca granosa TaxID=220873 RepID=A0ABQ9F4N6_TEGGR|nr:LOW QUALITY PROTEIN: hypothetical protein KUTeg_011272 [Tegillarca granosa]
MNLILQIDTFKIGVSFRYTTFFTKTWDFLQFLVYLSSVSLEGITGQEITVTSGQSKSITCVTGASRPASRILWYIGLTNVTLLSTETQIPSQELFYTRSTLAFIPIKSQNGLKINCKAYNTDNNIMELSTKPTLNVQYGPGHVTLTPPFLDNITYQLGPMKCSATCEPPCNYRWIRPNQGVIQGDTLMINSIQRTQTGTYKCQAYNTVGTQNSNAAAVTRIEINNGNNFTIPEHSTKTIFCLAEGLPQPIITLRFISNNSIIKSVNDLRLDFTFPFARCEDTGIYKCEATNTFTSRLPLQRIIFNVSGGSSVEITDDQKDVQIKNAVVNAYTFVTEFIRTNLHVDGFGTYILKTSNIIGTDEDVFTVRQVGKPDEPLGFLATCIGSNAAVITWTSGSNNGDGQTFNIVYQEVDGTEQTLVSDIIDPGVHKPISHTIVSLKESKTYFFQIYSKNSFGESSRLKVNCSTKAKPIKEASLNAGVAVGVTLASVVIVLIVFAGVIYFLRRYQSAKGVKDIKDVQVDDRNTLRYETLKMPNDQQTYEQIKLEDNTTNYGYRKKCVCQY